MKILLVLLFPRQFFSLEVCPGWHLGGEQAEDPTEHARMWFREQKHFNSFNTTEFCHGLHWRLRDLWKWALPLP